MFRKIIHIKLVLSMFYILGSTSYIFAQNTNLSELKDVSYDDSTGNINFVFSSKLSLLSTPKINYHDEYFEFVVQDAFVKEASFFDINSSLFSKVGVYPVTVDSLGIRIFTDKQTSLDKYQFSQLDFNNNILTFDFDKYKYDQLVIAKSKDSSNQMLDTNDNSATDSGSVVATAANEENKLNSNEVNESDLLSNIASIKNSLSSSSSTSTSDSSSKNLMGSTLKFKDSSSIRSNITSIVIFIVFLSLGCMVLYFLRPALLRKKSADRSQNLNIKTLAVSNLSAKQKITLIEIAGEKILLGVSSNNISFLTKLSDNTQNVNAYDNSRMFVSNPSVIAHQETNSLNAFKPSSSLKESSSRPSSSHISGAYYDKESSKSTRLNTKSFKSEQDSLDNYDPSTGDLKPNNQKHAIENVTKLIREKLKNLPSMEE